MEMKSSAWIPGIHGAELHFMQQPLILAPDAFEFWLRLEPTSMHAWDQEEKVWIKPFFFITYAIFSTFYAHHFQERKLVKLSV